MKKKNKLNNYLNEYSYEELKIANEKAFNIMNEFVDEISINLFSNIEKYINRPFELINILNKIKFLSEYNYNKVKYEFGLCENEIMKKSNGKTEVYRYYNEEVGISIFNMIYVQESLLKAESKKMLKCLTSEGKKVRDKIRNEKNRKLDNIQKEVFYSIDNDPTI